MLISSKHPYHKYVSVSITKHTESIAM